MLPDVPVFTLAQFNDTHPEKNNVCKYSRNLPFQNYNSAFYCLLDLNFLNEALIFFQRRDEISPKDLCQLT